MSFWSGVSGVISGIFLIDMAAWLVSGKGLGELVVSGQENPLVLAIVDRLVGIPDWAFWIAVGASIVILSGIMCLAVMFAGIMLCVDLLYAFVDPRIKAKYSGRRG